MNITKKKIAFIFGTRPEAIKLAPVIKGFKTHSQFDIHVCVTAQHREMLDPILQAFTIIPDVDLNIMKPNQTLSELTTSVISGIDNYLSRLKPDLVVVQGDTTSVFAASLVSFYHKIPVAHVEAGLRTYNRYSPFPEEVNRVLTSHLADIHFAPTEWSKNNLLKEGVDAQRIIVTGNTVIDALKIVEKIIKKNPPLIDSFDESILKGSQPIILITGHRRENFGERLHSICSAILALARTFPDYKFIYPVHLNPNVKEPVHNILGKQANIYLIEPLNYLSFVSLMLKSKLILTDSGGIQEEAPSLGIPVLVMRDTTERPEGISTGTVTLVGTNMQSIYDTVYELLTNKLSYNRMATSVNPYGDGRATERIIDYISSYFGKTST